MSNYATISKFGTCADGGAVQPGHPANPLSYCMFNELGSKFNHGAASATHDPQSMACMSYMADYASGHKFADKVWDAYAEHYVKNNTDTAWPNQGAVDIAGSNVTMAYKKLSLGECLLRNTVERRFLHHLGLRETPFDPNVANTQSVRVPMDACTPSLNMAHMVGLNDDPVMNKALENPQCCLDVFVTIATLANQAGIDLSSTKLGEEMRKNAAFYSQIEADMRRQRLMLGENSCSISNAAYQL